MKYILTALLLLLPLGLFADAPKVGAPLVLPAVQDQFEKPVALTPQTRQVIIAYTKKHGDVMKCRFHTKFPPVSLLCFH